MYHLIVKRKILRAFDALSRGDRDALINQMSADVHHTFPGDHALGGERTNSADVGAWLDRLFRLFPGLGFTVHAIAVSGPRARLEARAAALQAVVTDAAERLTRRLGGDLAP